MFSSQMLTGIANVNIILLTELQYKGIHENTTLNQDEPGFLLQIGFHGFLDVNSPHADDLLKPDKVCHENFQQFCWHKPGRTN